jgi:hypothetical protein
LKCIHQIKALLKEGRVHQIKALLYLLLHTTVHIRKSSSKAVIQIDIQAEKFLAYDHV